MGDQQWGTVGITNVVSGFSLSSSLGTPSLTTDQNISVTGIQSTSSLGNIFDTLGGVSGTASVGQTFESLNTTTESTADVGNVFTTLQGLQANTATAQADIILQGKFNAFAKLSYFFV